MTVNNNIIKNSHPMLIECIQHMLVDLKFRLPFYGEFNLSINFHSSKNMPTCGVNVTRRGMNFYYNPKFLEDRTQEEVNFITIHENFHLLFNHPNRTVTGNYNHKLANVTQDMIINSCIINEISQEFAKIPKEKSGKNMALFVPKEYKGEHVFEELYEWLKSRKKENNNNNNSNNSDCETCGGSGKVEKEEKDNLGSNDGNNPDSNDGNNPDSNDVNSNVDGDDENGDGEGDGNGKGDGMEPCPDCGGKNIPNKDSRGNDSYGNYGQGDVDCYSVDSILDNLDKNNGEYMDIHMEDEVPDELRDAIVKDTIERLKARGLSCGNVENVLNTLRKKRKDYLREIKKSVSNIIFGDKKQRTISRPNRRGIFGLKGNRKIKSKINCILDTSGSMSGLFEKVLSYIFRNDIEVNLIQCDTKVTKTDTIKNKKQLSLLHIKGLGGTTLQPAFDKITDEFNMYNTVVLTDGFTDSLDMSLIKGKVLILSTDHNCPISSVAKKGLKQIIIEPTK